MSLPAWYIMQDFLINTNITIEITGAEAERIRKQILRQSNNQILSHCLISSTRNNAVVKYQ